MSAIPMGRSARIGANFAVEVDPKVDYMLDVENPDLSPIRLRMQAKNRSRELRMRIEALKAVVSGWAHLDGDCPAPHPRPESPWPRGSLCRVAHFGTYGPAHGSRTGE